MGKKRSSGWKQGTDSTVALVRLKEGEERRDKRKCLHYGRGNQNKCGFGNGECISTSQCPDYTEDKSPENVEKYYPGNDLIESATVYEADRDLFNRTLKNAQCHNVSSMFQVAQYYEHGRGVEKDYVQAMKWYKDSFRLGKQYGAVAVGRLYEDGLGTKQDLREALLWYKKGEAVNEPGAKKRAEKLRQKLSPYIDIPDWPPLTSLPEDTKEETGLFTDFISELPIPSTSKGKKEQKEEHAFITNPWLLGQAAYEKEQWAEAYQYFEQAAKAGKIEAVCRLADMYYDGIGIPQKDYKKAFQYYQQAVLQDPSYAMHQLGMMYVKGEGFEPSNQDAFDWLRRSFDENHPEAKDDFQKLFEPPQSKSFEESNSGPTVVLTTLPVDGVAPNETPAYKKPGVGDIIPSLKDIVALFSILLFIFIGMGLVIKFFEIPTSTTDPVRSVSTVQQSLPSFPQYTIGTINNPYSMTAEKLMEEYNRNPRATERRYKGKFLQLTGTVVHMGTFFNSDHKYIRVYFWKHNNMAYEVIGDLEARYWLETIQVGNSITMLGRFEGAVKQPSDNVVSLQLDVIGRPRK